MIIVCLLGTFYLRAADDVLINPVSDELPPMLKVRIDQMNYLPVGFKKTNDPCLRKHQDCSKVSQRK